MLGRLSGFFRETLVAANFGVSLEADIVVLMLSVPDLMVSILMGGAMGAVLVPAFTQSPDKARMLLSQAMLVFAVVFCLIAAGLSWQAKLLVSILVPGFSAVQVSSAAKALDLVLWLIPLTVLAGTTTAYLHSRNKFIVASLGTLVVNISIIAGLYLVLTNRVSMELLALFVILGGLLRLASQAVAIRPVFQPQKYLGPLLLTRTMLVRYCQAMFSGSLLFLYPVVARAFASFDEVGSVAVLNYSMRLIELPMAICISFLSVVLFPRLSQSFASDPGLHQQYVRYGTQATLALSMVAVISLLLLADEYSTFVYGHGDMSVANVAQVAYLISIGLLVLPFQGLAIYNTALFNSRNDTRTPMIINGIGLLFFLVLLKFNLLGTGLGGIMWGFLTSFSLILVLQLFALRLVRYRLTEIYLDRAFLKGGICAIVICLLSSYGIASLDQHAWLKLMLGGFNAVVCLIVMTLFYSDIRKAYLSKIFDLQ